MVTREDATQQHSWNGPGYDGAVTPIALLYVLTKPTDHIGLAEMSSHAQLRVEVFQDLESLMQRSETEPPDIAVIDLDTLPRISAATLDAIRTSLPGSELIALSSQDTSQAVLTCFRCGFRDYLLKPLQPEELKWTVERSIQREHSLAPLRRTGGILSSTILDIASATSPTVIRLICLKQICHRLGATAGIWAGPERDSKPLVSFPKQSERDSKKRTAEHFRRPFGKKRFSIWKSKSSGQRRISIALRNPTSGSLILWGIPNRVNAAKLREALALLEYAELGLRNLSKLAEVRRQTYVDDLTDLFNARYLRVALETAVEECRAKSQEFSLLFMDLDRFKQINDQHGHTVGSEALVMLGRILKNSVRKNDAVFRYGGDEFVILLKNTGKERAHEVGERLRKMIERRVFVVKGTELRLTVSVGIAVYPIHARRLEDLLKLADKAMYAVKHTSRNAVQLAEVAL